MVQLELCFRNVLTDLQICHKSDRRIQHVNKIEAFYVGTRYSVKVHIFLDSNMPRWQERRITDDLQHLIEDDADVQCATVVADEWRASG